MPIPLVPLHPNGPMCSQLIFGAWRLSTWKLSTLELIELLHASIDLGITTVDHADIYGDYSCEGLFGAALRDEPGLRAKLQLISKCGIKLVSAQRPGHSVKHYDTTRAHLLASVDRSLSNLHTDHLDLLLLHRPDPYMDVSETAEALEHVVKAGKVRFVGVSNFTPSQYDLLASRLSIPLVTNQIEISVLKLNAFTDGSLDHCQIKHIAPMAWSPLGGGSLFNGTTPQAERLRTTLADVGQHHGNASIDVVALAWLLNHPAHIFPVLGTGKVQRLEAAAEAVNLKLTREQWFKIWSASTGVNVP
ncbi:MAG: aldo/keto reductase [Planctomycetota bacterium]